jgi:pseudouridine kinase
MKKYAIAVVGGNNLDIGATSGAKLAYGDSNPGRIRTGLGGVGRNIAENLARLGQSASLVTVFGDDGFSRMVAEQTEKTGVNLRGSLRVPGAAGCVYVCVNDADGDMAVAVNDMALCERLTPSFLETKIGALNAADAVVLDANLPEASLTMLAERCAPPLFADAVSAKKAGRLAGALPRLCALKANRMEMELLTGVPIGGKEDLLTAARVLHGKGVRYVLVTLGADGAFASNGAEHAFAPVYAGPVVNTTGCGDAFTAAATVAILEQRSLPYTLRMGLAAAHVCARSEDAVSDRLTRERLQRIIRTVANKEALG